MEVVLELKKDSPFNLRVRRARVTVEDDKSAGAILDCGLELVFTVEFLTEQFKTWASLLDHGPPT